MWERSLEDLALDAAVLEGAHRCLNKRNLGTSASVPPMHFVGQERNLVAKQKEVYNQDTLDVYQVELLRRALSFLEFWDANVGGTDDFPLVLHGDHIEAINLLNMQLSRLRAAAGLLSEV